MLFFFITVLLCNSYLKGIKGQGVAYYSQYQHVTMIYFGVMTLEMNLIFSRLMEILTKKGRKTV